MKGAIKLNPDIYSLAYAAFIDPKKIDKLPGFLQEIHMTDEEVEEIYLGACIVILIQITVLIKEA